MEIYMYTLVGYTLEYYSYKYLFKKIFLYQVNIKISRWSVLLWLKKKLQQQKKYCNKWGEKKNWSYFFKHEFLKSLVAIDTLIFNYYNAQQIFH